MPLTQDERIRYRTLARVGHWCLLDAECWTEPSDKRLINVVRFALINQFGDRCQVGCSIITGQSDCLDVFDEEGESFASLEAAIRRHADKLLKLTTMPGTWIDRPVRHLTWQGAMATAFDV